MFRGDMVEQGRKLMAMIGAVVARLDRLAGVDGAVQDLGRRHAGYGVADSHYDTVGAALLGRLRAGLGQAWSAEAEQAWATVSSTLADVMKAAAAEVTSSTAVLEHAPGMA